MRRAITLIVLACVACSGKTADVAEPTTERTTTTAAPTPEEAFKADVAGVAAEDQLDPLVEFAKIECDAIDNVIETAPTATLASLLVFTIGLAWGPDGLEGRGFEPAAVDTVMRATTEHFCPAYTDVVDEYIAAQGR